MSGPARGSASLVVAVALASLFACADAEPGAPRYAAPAQARATLLLEPPVVAVGEVSDLTLVVVTKPGHAVRPGELPKKLPGFWLLSREPQEIVKEPARWLHRTKLRLRAIEVGRFEVPGGSVVVASPEGGSEQLDYEPLPLEVSSVLAAHANRQSPYAVRTLPATSGTTRGSVFAFAAGAVLALASVGMLLLVRRRLAEDAGPHVDAEVAPAAWEHARERLAQARRAAADDPRRALDLASAALRGYAERRFGGDAAVRTTEELAAAKPPFTLTTRYPRFLELLAALDAARFPALAADATRAGELIDEVAGFVEESVPVERRA